MDVEHNFPVETLEALESIPITSGQLLNDEFRMETKIIGTGGFSEVYLGTNM